jgi:hypothetical protein
LFKSISAKAEEKKWKKRRIMLYLHGGLNSEKEVARRVISFREVCLDNEIYPVHIMWETDFWNSLRNQVFDIFTGDDRASANWLGKLREAAYEIRDRTFELTASRPGTMLWDEMKENAQLASLKKADASARKRAMVILAEKGMQGFKKLDATEKKRWEIHIVGHSAGTIFTAYALEILLQMGIPVRSIQFLAPAISLQLFREKILPLIRGNDALRPTVYVLSDKGERDDQVGPYGKSLLYLVSNAFERKREWPLLGMEKFINSANRDLDPKYIDREIAALLQRNINGWPSLVIAGKAPARAKHGPDICRSETHGGFDNDPFTLNSVLFRILGKIPERPFEASDLQ